jgi:hypothetical protein
LSAGAVWLGTRLSASTQAFAALNLLLIVVWVIAVAAVGREHARRSKVAP